MYFEAADADVFEAVRRDLFELNSNLSVTRFGLRSAPTHTEDGIPIRKLYVSNLPSKTTRSELFGVFAQYGFIKSCWLRMGEKGPNRSPIPTYAFVTFSNPEDAHKALRAPCNEKVLRGRTLRTSPADSWHQPAVDPDGRVRWRPHGYRQDHLNLDNDYHNLMSFESSMDAVGTSASESPGAACNGSALAASADVCTTDAAIEEDSTEEKSYSVLDILNRDCWKHILDYVPVRDLIRSERVSKGWQNMIQEYIEGIRTFKTSWWQHVPVTLTTAVLRRVLQRLGGSLLRLHIDHHWSALNDRTAHCVGKFCPNLEEIKVVGMHTKNWNPLIYGCKELKKLTFVSCNKLTDSSLVHLVKSESCIESLGVSNNTHVTGLFLTGTNHLALRSLSFYNCYSLQGTVLSAAIDTLPNLTCLKLDVCPVSMWKIVPLILSKLPKLEELSLSEYTSNEYNLPKVNDAFCESLANLTQLKVLNLSRNVHITNAILKQVAQSCPNLESLNVSSCNSQKSIPGGPAGGVGDEGVCAVCAGCSGLRALDVSYLAALGDAGLAAAAGLRHLTHLTVRGNGALTSRPLVAVIRSCHHLREVDACGCNNLTVEVALAAARAVSARPRPLALHLAGTAAAAGDHSSQDPLLPQRELPKHKMLTLNVHVDRSNPHLRPDFVDQLFDDSSDESLEDLFEHPLFEDFLGPDDELFMDDEDMEDFDAVFPYAIEGPNVILL